MPAPSAPSSLTDLQKQTLRLLREGHDAKSIARETGRSVHTINERLRDARRTLGVSSSREAARLLAAWEGDPERLGDERLGDARSAGDAAPIGPPARVVARRGARRWMGGTMMMMMSLAIAAWLALPSHMADPARSTPAPAAAAALDPAAVAAATGWIALVDAQRWDASWSAAAAMFRQQLSAADWAARVRPVRAPLGALVSRTPLETTLTRSLPGAPAGRYCIVTFRTSFAHRKDATETAILVDEGGAWRVAGYFIR